MRAGFDGLGRLQIDCEHMNEVYAMKQWITSQRDQGMELHVSVMEYDPTRKLVCSRPHFGLVYQTQKVTACVIEQEAFLKTFNIYVSPFTRLFLGGWRHELRQYD